MADSIYNGGPVWMDHSRCRYRPSAVAGWLRVAKGAAID
jgi:hypothetical protein